MHVLLSCATPTEAKPLRKLLTSIAGAQRFGRTWIWQGGDDCFEVLVSGISQQAVLQSLRQWKGSEPDAIVIFGLAGGLQPFATTGTIVIPEEWRSDVQTHVLRCGEELLQQAARVSTADQTVVISGAGVTLQRPALSSTERTEVRRKFPAASICDMETYFVMQRFQTRSLGIRIVSDDGIDARKVDFKQLSSVLAQFVFRFLLALREGR